MIKVSASFSSYLIDLCSVFSYSGTGTHGSFWDEPGGDLLPDTPPRLGGVRQWSTFSSSRNRSRGLLPFRDFVALALDGQLLRWPSGFDLYQACGKSAHGHGSVSSDAPGQIRYSERWSERHQDRMPVNLVNSLVGVMDPVIAPKKFLEDSDIDHANGRGTYRIKPASYESLEYSLSESNIYIGLSPLRTSTSSDWKGLCAPRRFPTGWFAASEDYPSSGYVFDDQDAHLAVGDALHACQLLSQQVGFSTTWYDSSGSDTWTLDAFEYHLNDDAQLLIEYTYTTGSKTYWHHIGATYKVRITITTKPTLSLASPYEYGVFRLLGISPSCTYEYRLVGGHHDVKDGDGTWYPTAMAPYTGSTWRDIQGHTDLDVVSASVYMTSAPYSNRASAGSFDRALQYVQSDIEGHGDYWFSRRDAFISASFYAYQKAIESVALVLKTNYIQTLSKVSSLPELIPDGRLLINCLVDLYKRDPRGLVKLGDFVASEVLKYNFGTAPNARSLRELNSQSSQIRALFKQSLRPKTRVAEGIFRYAYDKSETKYAESQLSVHCMTSLTYSPTPFGEVLIDLYGIGILPTLSRIWEIIPFSFVVDWITHAKDRIKTIDQSVLSLAYRHNWSIYTYRVSSKITKGVCMAYADMDPRSSAELVAFSRLLTTRTPPLYDGGVDFLRVTGNPNLGVLGSLFYQLTS